jgi:hypothetical protein
MFVLAKERSVWWPIEVQEPIDDGKFETRRFNARLKLLDLGRLGQLSADEMLSEILLDWTEVRDEAGVAITYSAEVRDRLIAVPYIRAALLRAYRDAVGGAREKN